MTDRFTPFRLKMEADGLSPASIRAFEHTFRALERNETGMIAEDSIESVPALPHLDSLPESRAEVWKDLLEQTIVIKLNGGLGTSMGLERAKSLLPVRDGLTFLDLIVRQIFHLREKSGGAHPRFLLMNSFSTSADTKAALAAYPELGSPDSLEMLQSRVPKVDAATLAPVRWPHNPALEWCPPGHGDIYPTLLGSGMLDSLLEQGVIFAFVSNSDNLGADLNPRLLQWFAKCGSPFVMEVTRRTTNDRKGGHLARQVTDGGLCLRESAQCSKDDQPMFEDIGRHRYFNTNNLWIRLDRLKQALDANDGVIPLPLIRNNKTVDPRDSSSPKVYQLETAMGAAIGCFPDAAAVEVPRSRFAPVKTTGDLFLVRSNACRLTHDFRVELHPGRNGKPPVVELDEKLHKLVDALDFLTANGVPDVSHCNHLKLLGHLQFAEGVELRGDVEIDALGDGPVVIPAGEYSDGKYSIG
jgi:UDP-N-acetylglucosamine pyrophosphorylase